MTQFQASLIAAGDPEPLPTTVEIDEGKMTIASNGQALGDWQVSELEFERIVGGFRVNLDGEIAVLKVTDSDSFDAALARMSGTDDGGGVKTKERSRKVRKVKEKAPAPPAGPPREEPGPASSGARPAEANEAGLMQRLDARLEVASKKWDKYLPDWVFTRGGLALGAILLLAIVFFRTIFSTIFLIVAAVGLVTSAIALLDQVIATRIFRGGFTPIHGLIGSLALVLVSLLLAAF